MPREFDPENYEETPEDFAPLRANVPATVRIAGVIWMVFGSLILLAALATIFVAAAPGPAQEVRFAAGGCGAALYALFGFAFIFVGYQSVYGTAKDTLGNAIGSIVIGLFPLIGGLVNMVTAASELSKGNAATNAGVFIIIGGINLISGVGLMVAGILALVGRAEYKAWRRWRKEGMSPTREDEQREDR